MQQSLVLQIIRRVHIRVLVHERLSVLDKVQMLVHLHMDLLALLLELVVNLVFPSSVGILLFSLLLLSSIRHTNVAVVGD